MIGTVFLSKYHLFVDVKKKHLVGPLTRLSVNVIAAACKIFLRKLVLIENTFLELLRNCPTSTTELDYTDPIKHKIVHQLRTEGVPPFSKFRRLDSIKYKIAETEFEFLVKSVECITSSCSVASPPHS